MSSPCRYPIPAKGHQAEETIQRSRFITLINPADTMVAAQQFFEDVRQQYPDATHHCWAYLIGRPGSSSRVGMSDDGEPHGTAGRPMLNVLSHSGVGDIAAVVVRYYGGTKLGKGGLVRAYGNGVANALKTLPTIEKVNYRRLRVLLDYSFVDPLKRLIDENGVSICEEAYGLDPSFELDVPEDVCENFLEALTQMTGGGAMTEMVD